MYYNTAIATRVSSEEDRSLSKSTATKEGRTFSERFRKYLHQSEQRAEAKSGENSLAVLFVLVSKMANSNNYMEKITLRLSPAADAWLPERISSTHGQMVCDRLRNYLRRDMPESLPVGSCRLNRTTIWRKKSGYVEAYQNFEDGTEVSNTTFGGV